MASSRWRSLARGCAALGAAGVSISDCVRGRFPTKAGPASAGRRRIDIATMRDGAKRGPRRTRRRSCANARIDLAAGEIHGEAEHRVDQAGRQGRALHIGTSRAKMAWTIACPTPAPGEKRPDDHHVLDQVGVLHDDIASPSSGCRATVSTVTEEHDHALSQDEAPGAAVLRHAPVGREAGAKPTRCGGVQEYPGGGASQQRFARDRWVEVPDMPAGGCVEMPAVGEVGRRPREEGGGRVEEAGDESGRDAFEAARRSK
ncbi:MAG: hypothetical protein R6V44_12825 [Paracoccaceae bacterium]